MSNGRTASLFGGDAPRATGPALPDAADDARHDTTRADAGAAASLARDVPLAERLRPRTLDDVVGQAHLLGPGKPLRVAWERHHLHSMILWGPPGVGKTTLARLMAGVAGAQFISLSAVLSGVKDIREAVEQAREARAAGRSTVVFVDEVHRFNKAQQDAFLPHVESGLFTFIGATTENPSFEVNSALLSRATVHVLKPLETADLMTLLARAQAALDSPPLSAEAGKRLVAHCDGDARRLLNDLENVVAALPVLPHGPGAPGVASPEPIDEQTLERLLGEQLRRYDKGGDHFYDTISALHKAVRGSDPDAALYWLARMLDGGADPRYVARRMLRMASEDIGLADPRALQLALQAAEVYDRMGSPEGELALAQALVYLAVAPKSNAVYVAWSQARDFVRRDGTRPVPERLRNAPTRLMKDLGFGRGYRYAHDEQDAFAAGERYFPDDVDDQRFYQPPPRGLEARIAQRLAELRAANAQAEAAADSRAAARDSTDGAQKADP